MKRLILLLIIIVSTTFAGQSKTTSSQPLSIKSVDKEITLTGSVAGTVQFTLYDLKGRQLHRVRKVVHPGQISVAIPNSLKKNQVLVMEMSDGRWEHSEQFVLR